jgi:hypothetical protein
MRSKLITAVAVVTSSFLGTSVAAADPVQEQLRLMEQRMEEMEDRLQATSEKLKSAEETVQQQQTVLSEAGSRRVRGRRPLGRRHVPAAGRRLRSRGRELQPPLPGREGSRILFLGDSFRHQQRGHVLARSALADSRQAHDRREPRRLPCRSALRRERAGDAEQRFVGSPRSTAAARRRLDISDQNDFYLFSAYASYLAPIGNGIRFDRRQARHPDGHRARQDERQLQRHPGSRIFQLVPITNTGLLAQTNVTTRSRSPRASSTTCTATPASTTAATSRTSARSRSRATSLHVQGRLDGRQELGRRACSATTGTSILRRRQRLPNSPC